MIPLVRRFLVVTALMFWQGGFLFYASVVVPVGQQVLSSHRRQGFVTQQVTDYLNLSGAVALLPLAWDAAATGDPSPRRRRARWAAWLGMALALAALAWLHLRMDNLLDAEQRSISDLSVFRPTHRIYLWISSAQWGLGVVYAFLMLVAWRAEDRQSREAAE